VVGDYLIAEVLNRQSPKLRSFLLRTSIVDRICGELADALTAQASSSDVLAALERSNDRFGERSPAFDGIRRIPERAGTPVDNLTGILPRIWR
jgi:hypothetical protein